VTVVSVRHREFACGGCNAELPLDAFSRVSAQNDSLVTCMNCGRILYMDVVPERPGTKKTKAEKRDEALEAEGM
jgi:predicted  nucleic acid-binding Zn-ribbon protein